MYSFLKIFIVVVLALVLIDWIAGRQAENWTNIPNAAVGWASLSSNIKIRSAMPNESPKGTAPLLDETFLPGDIKYENPKGNVHIYFPIATAIVLSILIWLFVSTKRHEMGMGLGLTISRMIIDYHGGKLNRIVGRQRGCIIPVPNANCAYRQRRYSRGRNYCHLDGRSFCAAQARDQSLASRDLLAAADEVIE